MEEAIFVPITEFLSNLTAKYPETSRIIHRYFDATIEKVIASIIHSILHRLPINR